MACYYCGCTITDENRSNEHIIIESIGGKLTSNELLCSKCNPLLGSNIDIEIFEQLKFASVYLGFSEKNNIEMQTLDGEQIVLGKGFSPYNRGTIYIPNSDKEQYLWKKDRDTLIKALEKNRSQVKNKYSELSLIIHEYENINKEKLFFLKQKNSKTPGKIFFGGDKFFKAIIKMSIGFAKHCNLSDNYLRQGVATLKGETNIVANFFYPTTYSVRLRFNEDLSHLLYLKGDPQSGVLYVYSELFSFSHHMCILSTDYDGEPIERLYHYDLFKREELKDTKINIRLNRTFAEDCDIILKSMFENNQKVQSEKFIELMKLLEKYQLTPEFDYVGSNPL